MTGLLLHPILVAVICGLSACSSTTVSESAASDIIYTGSTPGDELMKSLLGIEPETYVDFIRWNITIHNTQPDQGLFSLHINFGEGQPNSAGFKGGGEITSLEGEYRIAEGDKSTINSKIYHLTSARLPSRISLVRLDENLLHFLTPDSDLMVGNGGWSYTLYRKEPLEVRSRSLPALMTIPPDTSRQSVFDGRTPCYPFAQDYQLQVGRDCTKLKWRLILNRDPGTLAPTTYQIQRTNIRETPITGTWTILTGTPSDPDATIYQLDPETPEASVYFLVGDAKVLFLLDKERRFYVGDENFGFTLNRK